jgi:hypothetical protein
MNTKRFASKDKQKTKENKPMPEMSLNMSRSRDQVNTSKFMIKVPSLTRPDPKKKIPDLKEEIASNSKQRKALKESRAKENDFMKLEVSSGGSSELRH